MRVLYWILFLLGAVEVASLVLARHPDPHTWGAAQAAGAALLTLVFAWVFLARVQLGKSFSATPQARHLVTTGLYRRIRNPIYCASPFLIIGLALLVSSGWPLLLLIVILPLQVTRARREADVLRAAFGAEYDRYRAQTWF